MSADAATLARELEVLRERAETGAAPGVDELLEGLRAAVVALQVAEDELDQQNEKLAVLQRTVQREAERYRDLFHGAPLAYVTTDRRGNVIEANGAAGDLLGVEVRFLVGKPLPMFATPEDARRFGAFLARIARSGSGELLDVRLHRPTGGVFDARFFAAANREDIRWTIRDVTEERDHEQRLRELNEELEARVAAQAGEIETVLQQLPVGVAIVDADNGSVRRANPRTREILGDAPFAHVEDLRRYDLDAAELPTDRWALNRALAGEIVTDARLVLRLPRGERVVRLDAAPLRGASGHIDGAVLLIDDITEKQRREEADRNFVSNASHQLRTPLTAIASAIAVLQSGAKEIPEERDRFLGHLERETDRLSRLGRALLTLARAERAEEEPPVTIVPLQPLLEGAAGRRKHDTPVVVECGRDVAVLANADLLEEALWNLVENAVAYANADGVAVRAALTRSNDVEIVVADTGPGMSAEARENALARFYRAPGARSGGFGLGLPIAKAAVEATGGTLALESTEGVGTTATIRIRGGRIVS